MATWLRRVGGERHRIRFGIVTLAVGILVALLTGLVPNQPEMTITGARFYGYPLYWRIVAPEMGRHSIAAANLVVDVVVFWLGAILALPAARRARDWVDRHSTADA